MAGFAFRYRLSGAAPTIQEFLFKDTETLTRGDIANLEVGELDLGATGDSTFVGVILETKAGTDSTTLIEAITDEDAVYACSDLNARLVGATLDLAGATGAQSLASSSNKNFIVVAPSSATEETLVRFNTAMHFKNKAL